MVVKRSTYLSLVRFIFSEAVIVWNIPCRTFFESGKVRAYLLFVFLSLSEAICFLVCPALWTYAPYLMPEKRVLVQLLFMEKVTILAYYGFVGHRYLQLGRYTWRGSHCIHYHTNPSLQATTEKTKCACIRAKLCCSRETCNRFREKRTEQDVGQTAETSNDDKFDEGESKI